MVICVQSNPSASKTRFGGLQRSPVNSTHSPRQDLTAARKLVRSNSLRKEGMFYLEHEAAIYHAQTGKTYTIYGSPVGHISSDRMNTHVCL